VSEILRIAKEKKLITAWPNCFNS